MQGGEGRGERREGGIGGRRGANIYTLCPTSYIPSFQSVLLFWSPSNLSERRQNL